jgi:hypothetical protein
VVLDIGGERGALVLYLPEALLDDEVEIRPVGHEWDGTHTGVRRRDVRDGSCFAGVFGSLVAGEYELRVNGSGSPPVLQVTVVGGTVTEDRWPVGLADHSRDTGDAG